MHIRFLLGSIGQAANCTNVSKYNIRAKIYCMHKKSGYYKAATFIFNILIFKYCIFSYTYFQRVIYAYMGIIVL